MSKATSLVFLMPFAKKQLARLTIMVIALIISSSSVLLLASYMRYIIDHFLMSGFQKNINIILITQNSLITLLALGTSIRYLTSATIGTRLANDLKKTLLERIIHLPISYFDKTKTGTITAQINNDTGIIQQFVGRSLSVALRNIIMFIGSIIMLIISSLKLSLFILTMIPIILAPIIILGKKIKRLTKSDLQNDSNTAAICEESIHFIRTFQADNQQTHALGKFNKSLLAQSSTLKQIYQLKALLIFLVIFLVFVSVSMFLWYGGYNVIRGKISIGELSSFIFLSIICAGSLASLSETFADIIKFEAACGRIAKIASMPVAVADKLDAKSLPTKQIKNIKFQDVNFTFDKNDSVIHQFNLKITAKEKIAFIGKSGAGKSTLLQLLLRFYNLDAGKILIDGNDITDIKITSLRDKIAYISQEPAIFSDTIYNNILFGNPQASQAEIYNAAKIARVDEFTTKLPSGYDTFIGVKGAMLSGGQKQRIAIARAIVKNADILLLDEATSSLDHKNEALIQEAINKAFANKIVIMITHRLASLTDMDRIIVLQDGQIIADNSYKELVQKKGSYIEDFTRKNSS